MFRENVRRGIAWLDDHYEDSWVQRINLERLRLSSACFCILGQLEGSFLTALEVWGLSSEEASELGFTAPFEELYSILTEVWREEILNELRLLAISQSNRDN